MTPDIEIIVDFQTCCGDSMSVPAYDFEVKYYTATGSVTVKQTRGIIDVTGNGKAIVKEDGLLHLYIDSPSLGTGDLFRDSKLLIPDEGFPDGVRMSASTRRVGKINTFNA